MAWFLVGGVIAIVGMGTYEQNRNEDRRRFDAEMQLRREAIHHDCARLERQLAECTHAYRDACKDFLAMQKQYKC